MKTLGEDGFPSDEYRMRVYPDEILPGPPYPRSSFELEAVRDQILDYIWFAAHQLPPEWAERRITLAASRLIEVIAADYDATAREDAELEAEEEAERADKRMSAG
jgi:hypothetical protein